MIDAACLAGIALPLGAAATLWLPIPSDPRPSTAPAGPFAPPAQDQAPPPPPREGLASAARWFACVDAGIAAMVFGTQFVPAVAAVAHHATRSLTVAVTLACFALGGACAHAPAWLVLRRAGLWRWPAAILSGYAGLAASAAGMLAVKKLLSGARLPTPDGSGLAVAGFVVGAFLVAGSPFAVAGALVTVRRAKRRSA